MNSNPNPNANPDPSLMLTRTRFGGAEFWNDGGTQPITLSLTLSLS